MNQAAEIERKGLIEGTLAYLIWGSFGLYFTLLAPVPSDEVLAHRIIWCILFVVALLAYQHKIGSTLAIFKNWKTLGWLTISSLLISGNWYVYIWAVGSGQVLAASLGYFITPLLSVLLGGIFFKERFNKLQIIAFCLAVVGVLWQVFAMGIFPWIALSLGILFAFYGVIRKRVAVDSVSGLLVETAIVLPLALLYVNHLNQQNTDHFAEFWLPLVGSGLMTAVPLILYAAAARKLLFSTLGFLNYIAPIIQFLSAVFILGEEFSLNRFISFAFIWAALVVFSINLMRQAKKRKAG